MSRQTLPKVTTGITSPLTQYIGLVVSVVPGKRPAEQTEALVKDLHARTGGRMMDLLVSDAYPAYKTAMLHT